MGRSVCVPSYAAATAYLHRDDEDVEAWEWEEFIEDVRNVVRERFPSFAEADRWADREEHIILENGHAVIVLCDYCGTVSVSVVPKQYYVDRPELAEAWCNRIASGFKAHMAKRYPDSSLERLGFMSNGGSVYRRIGHAD